MEQQRRAAALQARRNGQAASTQAANAQNQLTERLQNVVPQTREAASQ